MGKIKTVGIVEINYNWHRNITSMQPRGFRTQRIMDPMKVLRAITRRVRGDSVLLKQLCVPPIVPGIDLLHLWRMVYFGSKPWLVTTSTGLPFGKNAGSRSRIAGSLAADNCHKILVTGSLAFDWQERRARLFPEFSKSMLGKIEVLPPPQQIYVGDVRNDCSEELVISIVGHDFVRKGGLEAAEVLLGFIKRGASIRFQVVSKLSDLTKAQQTHLESLCRDSGGRISLLGGLENDEVIEVFRNSNLALLLSYVETYGYSVLEAQACGCPVITTNVGAFCEINNEECGWIIPLSRDGDNGMSVRNRETITELKTGLASVLNRILGDPLEVQQKSVASVSRIRNEHCPLRHTETLGKIYRSMR